jgi:hypothetical protein
MTKEFLEQCLAEGRSLEQIAERIGRHPSTVSYHLKKHGLEAVGHEKHSPNAKVDPDRLRKLIAAGATIREAAADSTSGIPRFATGSSGWVSRPRPCGVDARKSRRWPRASSVSKGFVQSTARPSSWSARKAGFDVGGAEWLQSVIGGGA